jgi:hypothetical protein
MLMIVWWLNLPLHVQSVPITTKDLSLNLADGVVYSIQHYVIKLPVTCDKVDANLRGLQLLSPIKLTTTIWLKYY